MRNTIHMSRVDGGMTSVDYYTDRPGVLILAPALDRPDMGDAVAAAGARVACEAGWDVDGAPPEAIARLVVATVADLPPDQLPDALLRLADLAAITELGVVVSLNPDQIDPVAAALLGANAELLCDPDPATLVGAIALVLARRVDALLDTVHEAEAERLRRLNAEVARIAEVLARLTRETDLRPHALADRRDGYGAPPPGAPDVSANEIRKAIRARRLRGLQFPTGMFEDPAWDMLLDLYAAYLEGSQVSVSSLCIAAAVPPTTALRWIGRMTDSGLFVRHPDPFDRRRAFMALSDEAREKMDRYFVALAQNGLPIV